MTKQDVIDRLGDYVKSYKSRQDQICIDLRMIQTALNEGHVELAQVVMADLLATNLKQARERVDNHTQALSIAVDVLREVHTEKSMTALSNIRALSPEAFPAVRASA